jgi:pimeloyl-ACP methyl ester carboxylesterase
MVTQCYIGCGNTTLAAEIHRPEAVRKAKAAVVLAAGFSQPMCDVDYFMSKLSRRLCDLGFFVLQFDPRGHGDSSEDIGDITLKTLYCDFEQAINFAAKQSDSEVYCVGRGLAATVFAGLSHLPLITGVAGINPFCVTGVECSRIWDGIGSGVFEATDLFQGSDYVAYTDFDSEKVGFCNALGALVYNLHGQVLSGDLLAELKSYDAPEVLRNCKKDALWLCYESGEKENVKELGFSGGTPCLSPLSKDTGMLPRDPMWQHNAITKICDWIGGCCSKAG